MGKLKECGVHSVEQLTERHFPSLATQRVQEEHEKWKASGSLETMIFIRFEGVCFIRTSE